jgi:hypothetical protein
MEQTHTGPWKEDLDKLRMATPLPIHNLDQMCKITNFYYLTKNSHSSP